MRFSWIVCIFMVGFALDYIVIAGNSGTYYEAVYMSNTQRVPEQQFLHLIQKYLHRCSLKSDCNYVVEDKKNSIKLYSSGSEIPVEEELLGIWMKVPRKYSYKVTLEKLNWNDARTKCQLHGGDLVSITSKQEEEKVKELLSNFVGNVYIWSGLNDIKEEGKYVWSDGSEYSYVNWENGEPNNLHNEDCMLLETSMRWYDYGCQNNEYFICKNEIV